MDEKSLFEATSCIAIHLPDLDEASSFYSGVLGFEVVGRSETELELRAGPLTLYVNRAPNAERFFIPSVETTDFDEARAQLMAAGCTVVHEYGPPRGMYFRDPFGLLMDVIET